MVLRRIEPAAEHARAERKTVTEVLDAAVVTADEGLVVARLADAKRIPLSRYSLALGQRYPDSLVVIIHRRQRLYCGRSSRRLGLDFIEHFRSRGLKPKGHPYVCTVDLPAERIEDELSALRAAIAP